jgi:hypothetical protein
MSILIVEVLSEGLIFGADRNITSTYGSGQTVQEYQRPKVLKWPNDETLFGFVGAARINGLPIEIWLDSIKDFISINSIELLAKELNDRVDKQRTIDEEDGPPEPLIIHLGKFEKRRLLVTIHLDIRNIYRLGRFSYLDIRKKYFYDEQFWRFFPDTDPSEIRKV